MRSWYSLPICLTFSLCIHNSKLSSFRNNRTSRCKSATVCTKFPIPCSTSDVTFEVTVWRFAGEGDREGREAIRCIFGVMSSTSMLAFKALVMSTISAMEIMTWPVDRSNGVMKRGRSFGDSEADSASTVTRSTSSPGSFCATSPCSVFVSSSHVDKLLELAYPYRSRKPTARLRMSIIIASLAIRVVSYFDQNSGEDCSLTASLQIRSGWQICSRRRFYHYNY